MFLHVLLKQLIRMFLLIQIITNFWIPETSKFRTFWLVPQVFGFQKLHCIINSMFYLILPMKYGTYQSNIFHIFVKINMKYKYESGCSQNSYLFLGTSCTDFLTICLKNLINRKQLFVEFCFENYLEWKWSNLENKSKQQYL
jgi:hypothetical protein